MGYSDLLQELGDLAVRAPSGQHYDLGTDGVGNMAIGSTFGSINPVSGAANNTAIGTGALASITTGGNNTAIGQGAGAGITTGNFSVAIGGQALGATPGTGGYSVAVGYQALLAATTGSTQNVAVGWSALKGLTTGRYNVGVGPQPLNALTTGRYNTAVGSQALYANTTGNGNTAVGESAGNYGNPSLTGSGNTYIGYQARTAAANDPSYGTALGSNAQAGNKATAVGCAGDTIGPIASGDGSVAIGADNTGGYAQAPNANQFVLGTALHQVQILNNATGAGAAALGANSPAVTPGAPYTWLKMMSGDGSTVYLPAWK